MAIEGFGENVDYAHMIVKPLPTDETLNARSGPGVDFPIIGHLAPGELVTVGERKINGKTPWRKIDGDGKGWVAENYLLPANFEYLKNTTIPKSGQCSGFEPYWFFDWSSTQLEIELNGIREKYPITEIVLANGYSKGIIVSKKDPSNWILFRYEDEKCEYLPLDNFLYGRGMLILTKNNKSEWYLGCCSPKESALLSN